MASARIIANIVLLFPKNAKIAGNTPYNNYSILLFLLIFILFSAVDICSFCQTCPIFKGKFLCARILGYFAFFET